jgi:hypothetical protein
MNEPNTPVEVYKAIIDQLVGETRLYGSCSHVAKSGKYSNAPAHSEYNEFIGSLSPQQRELLARMLQEERDGTIHDVLAALTWWIAARGVGFTFQGKPMPVELSGMGLHGDYVGRRDGWEWPASEQASEA